MFWEEDEPLFKNALGVEFYKIWEADECITEMGIHKELQVYGTKEGDAWEYVAVKHGEVIYSSQSLDGIDYALKLAKAMQELFPAELVFDE